jgi:hypothetical protein
MIFKIIHLVIKDGNADLIQGPMAIGISQELTVGWRGAD